MNAYLVLITYQAKPGCKEKFVAAVTEAGILEKIRQEDGLEMKRVRRGNLMKRH